MVDKADKQNAETRERLDNLYAVISAADLDIDKLQRKLNCAIEQTKVEARRSGEWASATAKRRAICERTHLGGPAVLDGQEDWDAQFRGSAGSSYLKSKASADQREHDMSISMGRAAAEQRRRTSQAAGPGGGEIAEGRVEVDGHRVEAAHVAARAVVLVGAGREGGCSFRF